MEYLLEEIQCKICENNRCNGECKYDEKFMDKIKELLRLAEIGKESEIDVFETKVYLVKAGEWESDIRVVCATEEIAKREVMKIAEEYEVEVSENIEDFIYYTEFNVIQK